MKPEEGYSSKNVEVTPDQDEETITRSCGDYISIAHCCFIIEALLRCLGLESNARNTHSSSSSSSSGDSHQKNDHGKEPTSTTDDPPSSSTDQVLDVPQRPPVTIGSGPHHY